MIVKVVKRFIFNLIDLCFIKKLVCENKFCETCINSAKNCVKCFQNRYLPNC